MLPFITGSFKDHICSASTSLLGYNVLCWNLLRTKIGGFVYGSVIKDRLTFNDAQRSEYTSKYAADNLAHGEVRVSVASALLEKQRAKVVNFIRKST